jgi:hypothetical protein
MVLTFGKDIAATTNVYQEPFAVVCHELGHLRRWIVDGVPGLYRIEGLPESSIDPDEDPIKRLFTTSGIDEQIEHCAIDGALPKYGFDVPRTSFQALWDSFPSPPWESLTSMKWVLLQEWIRTEILTQDTHLQQHAEGIMRRFGVFDQAKHLTDSFKVLLTSPDKMNAKFGMLLLLGIAFRIPLHLFWFIDRRPGILEIRQIPTAFEVRTNKGTQVFTYQLPQQPQQISEGETPCLS